MSARVLLWVQHLLGVGHVARAHAIAQGLVARGLQVTVALGGEPVAGLPFAGAEVVQLPPLRAGDLSFRQLLDENGKPASEALLARRRELLLDLGRRLRPQVLVTEHFPFGRTKLAGELLPLIESLRARSRIISSLRDVLVDKEDAAREARVVALVRTHFDRVLVHGDGALVPLSATFPAANSIGERIVYTGYVAPRKDLGPEPPGEEGRGEVIVSAGGGAVGQDLMRTALEARRGGLLAERRWRLLCGANLGEDVVAELRSAAPAGVVVEPARRDFRGLLARGLLSISQAGYNTLMDLIFARIRSVVVPFAGGAESEQTFRARLLQERGLVHVLDERQLSAGALMTIAQRALGAPAPGADCIDLDGVARTADIIDRLAEEAERGRA